LEIGISSPAKTLRGLCTGEEHKAHARINVENRSRRRDPIHARHRDVHYDQIGTQVARKLHSNLSVSRLLDNIRDISEQSDDKRAKRIVVVHDQCTHKTPLPPRTPTGLDYVQVWQRSRHRSLAFVVPACGASPHSRQTFIVRRSLMKLQLIAATGRPHVPPTAERPISGLGGCLRLLPCGAQCAGELRLPIHDPQPIRLQQTLVGAGITQALTLPDQLVEDQARPLRGCRIPAHLGARQSKAADAPA
jgi:hypothetical protein